MPGHLCPYTLFVAWELFYLSLTRLPQTERFCTRLLLLAPFVLESRRPSVLANRLHEANRHAEFILASRYDLLVK